MQLLLDIDPLADQTAIVSIGIQESPGVPAKHLHSLGAHTVFNLQSIKAHYDALGSYLHMPTLKQLETQVAPDLHKLRARCIAIESEVEAVLASPIYNVTFAGFAALPCGRCQKPIRRRIPMEAEKVEVDCFECGAPYEITRAEGKGLVEWHAKITNYQCIRKTCNSIFPIWRDQVQSGAIFECPQCQARYRLQLYMVPS